MYTPTANKHHDKPKLQNKNEFKPTHHHQRPNQSRKLKRVKGTSFIHPFAYDQRKQTKELFKLWIKSSSSSKAILFLVFQTIQNKHNGPPLHTFLRFLSTNEPCHRNRVSLTDDGNIQDTPKTAKSNSHKTLVFTQWTRRWFINSSST